jgi:hypothetical protein
MPDIADIKPIYDLGREMQIYRKNEQGEYSTATKVWMVNMMQGTLRQYGEDGDGLPKDTPAYTALEEATGISKQLLSYWWQNREQIRKDIEAVVEATDQYNLLLAITSKANLTQELASRDPKEMSTREAIDVSKYMREVQIQTVGKKQPDQIVEHQHKVAPMLPEGSLKGE